MSFRTNVISTSVHSGKCTFGQVSIRANVHSGKCWDTLFIKFPGCDSKKYEKLINLLIWFSVMLWLVRIIIQNGLCLPATWLTIATCLNLADVIIYQDSFGLPLAVTRGRLVGMGSLIAIYLIVKVLGPRDSKTYLALKRRGTLLWPFNGEVKQGMAAWRAL